ncbi:Aldolase-type TIM barrel [Phytophthora cactorum]|nr:Aldolase-type TIM barrel [Phytophthora cactorum]
MGLGATRLRWPPQHHTVEGAERATKLVAEREEETRELKQQLLQLTTEKDALSFKLQTATSLAERRLSEVEELQTTVREHNRLLVDAQRQEMQALERAAQQEAQVAPLTHALARAKKETEAAQQHSQWLETQLSEKPRRHAVAELSSAAGEAHLAAHGLTPKQMYDHIVELEETLQAERSEKDKLQLYMDRIVKEVQEKAPVLMGLRLDHERTVASHTQLSERLEHCMQELAKSKSNEQQAWKEKNAFEKKCESLAQSVDDLSRQVQHLLFRSQDQHQQLGNFGPGDVGSENLVVFKDVEELQVRNQQLLAVIRELTEMNKAKQATNLRTEREQEREMITAIVKQRDMYRVLLAQSDTKFLDGSAPSSKSGAQESATPMERPHNRRGSLDIIESRKLREVQMEFEDYKKEKQASLKMLQEALDQERAKSSESRLAQMQAQVEATCNKERYEASEERCANAENELIPGDCYFSLQSLSVEKDSAVREADFLRKNEEKIQQEMTTLRLDNTNLLKLMESTRRMETGREERDRREVETLTKKVAMLETKLQDAYEKFDVKEVTSGAQLLAAEREKQAALAELAKLKEAQGQLKEQLARLEEQKTALESKSALLEKETTHLHEQLRKGASAAAAERVAALEVQLLDAQREVQASLVSRKTLTESVTKYKALAEASDKSLAELSSASEKWKQSEAEKVQTLEKTRDRLNDELAKARAELKEHVTENSSLRDEIDRAEQTHKRSILEATEKQKMLQLQADSAVQQMNNVREEMGKMKRELETTQENYERELQLHAAEVAKSSSSRREMEEIRRTIREREADIEALNTKVQSVEKEAQLQLETLQKRLDEAVEAKNAVTEQNKLLHSQLERAAAQVRCAHEQEMLKMVGASNQEAGEGAASSNAHEKEIDDLRSVVAYLRRESEIAKSKLELSQQEVQRGRAQIFSLESTIERLRGEMKALSDADTAAGKQTAATSADDEKRVAQLEQLSLLRESNATLRDENQKSLARLNEEEAKVRSLEAKIVPLQNAEVSLKTQVASLKQEVETLNDANKRWKQRVDQLVEKYQQTEQSALKAELETLRSSGGKELEEEKKKVENWSKQYERIKGFAKNWKNKAEALTKQLAEKNKEVEDRSTSISTLEAKLSSVQAQISAVTAEKAALETKLATCEAAKQDSVTAASGANASWEKERLTLKAQLELETKKSTQLKDFNARLMSGLKSLKKENSELKDHAASATQPSQSAVEKTPVPSPPASPPQAPPSTSATPPTKPATAPAPLFTSPKPVVIIQATPAAPTPTPPAPSPPVVAPPKESTESSTDEPAALTAEEKLRLFALRSMKKQHSYLCGGWRSSEGKQEEDTPPTQADTAESQPPPPTQKCDSKFLLINESAESPSHLDAMVKIVPGSDATPLNVLKFEEYAREYLPKSTMDYFASGSDSMETLKENREAFKRLVLHPRVLRDVSKMDISTTLLGHRISSPVCVAPSSTHRMAHPDGEIASTSAVAKADTCFVLSTMSTTSLEDVATASSAANANALRWFQLYVFKDRQITVRLVRRAEKAGYKAIVLTVDAPVLGNREADVRNHFSIPKHLTMANFGPQNATTDYADYVSDLYDQTLSWKDVEWLKSITKLPIVAKGILTSEDAVMAVESGCEGILVSNHGARQLDGVAATIDALPAIIQAVGDRAEVYMDGGVRRGTDVFKALALGARAVFVGRPVLFGLAHSGKAGVSSVLRILNDELKHAMLFSGTASLADIGCVVL